MMPCIGSAVLLIRVTLSELPPESDGLGTTVIHAGVFFWVLDIRSDGEAMDFADRREMRVLSVGSCSVLTGWKEDRYNI